MTQTKGMPKAPPTDKTCVLKQLFSFNLKKKERKKLGKREREKEKGKSLKAIKKLVS